MIALSPLKDEDVKIIKTWPPYPQEFSELDYAIRDGGWLDSRENSDYLSIHINEKLIGFIGMSGIKENEADILIAMHADYICKGYGSSAMKMAIEYYFRKYNLSKITLVVRKTNHIAKHVYEKLGFKDFGESTYNMQGKLIEFWNMYIENKFLC